MLDFLLEFKQNSTTLKEMKKKKSPLEKKEYDYIEDMFNLELNRLKRIYQTKFNDSLIQFWVASNQQENQQDNESVSESPTTPS